MIIDRIVGWGAFDNDDKVKFINKWREDTFRRKASLFTMGAT